MRICQVLASWAKGGLEKHVIDLANALAVQHEVHVLVHPEMAELFAPAVHVHPIAFDRSRWSLRLMWQIFTTLRRIAPDVVHAQANKAASLLALVKPFLPGPAYVATIHNQKKHVAVFERYQRVIAVSEGIARQIRHAPVTAVYNGIRPPVPGQGDRDWLCRTFGFDAARPVLISVGRLVVAKGFDVLVRAAAASGTQVLIVGDGDLRDELQQSVDQLQAPVVLAGFRSDVARLMQSVDGYVMSSRREGFAYVIVEALLTGLPIVATRIPMVEGVMPEALLVATDDAEALAAALHAWVPDAQRWREAMAPAFRFAEANLTLDAMVGHTLDVYRELLP